MYFSEWDEELALTKTGTVSELEFLSSEYCFLTHPLHPAGSSSSSREQQGESGGQSPGRYKTFAASEKTVGGSGDEGEHWATTSYPEIS